MRAPTRSAVGVAVFAAGLGPLFALLTGDTFVLSIFERFLIYAVAAASLNLILGYGGMVSFGHAVYLGVGAYTMGLLANAGYTSVLIQIPVVMLVAALTAAAIGLIVLRTQGVHFIMITLALAQILYYLAQSSSAFGGDDGMVIYERTALWFGVDMYDSWTLYGFIAVLALIALYGLDVVVRSDFGRRLVAVRENSQRAGALGFDVLKIRLLGFILAGVACGLAGLLLANQTEFASPTYANWQRSGELLVIVILGGVGTRFGPVYGAMAFVLLEHLLAALTSHWPILFGPLLIVVVLFFRSGLSGLGQWLLSGTGALKGNP